MLKIGWGQKNIGDGNDFQDGIELRGFKSFILQE